MLNSEIAQQNANTNMREFLEQARNNRFGNQIAKEALALQKFQTYDTNKKNKKGVGNNQHHSKNSSKNL